MTNLIELIPILLQKTEEGKLEWDSLSNESFVARLGENAVEVGYNRQGAARLSLLDVTGRTLETALWSEIPSPWDQQLTKLLGIARRKALRVDETLADVKGFLDRL
jgi:hypothetical protein